MALTNKQKIYKEYLTHNNFSVEFSDDGKKITFICEEKHENIPILNLIFYQIIIHLYVKDVENYTNNRTIQLTYKKILSIKLYFITIKIL